MRADIAVVAQGVQNCGLLDYVTGWYFKAAGYIQDTAICVGFVSTNSISQGEQVGVLWNELFQRNLKIHFAYRTFPWASEARGKAHVHVVIIGFASFDIPVKRLFEDTQNTVAVSEVPRISPYLVEGNNTVILNRSRPLCDVPEIGIGNKPIDGGNYLFKPEEKTAFLKLEPGAAPFFRRWIGSDEFINNIERWCLWLGDCSPDKLRQMPHAMKRVEAVRDFRLASKSAPTRKLAAMPTRFHVENAPDSKFLVIPKVSSERRVFVPIGFISPTTLVSDLCFILPNATLYHFGVLTSTMHTVNGPGGLLKAMTGTLTLSGTATYAGPTAIFAGTMAFARPTSLYNANASNWTPANIMVASNATLMVYVGGAGVFTSNQVGTLLASLSTVNSNGLQAGSIFGFDTGTGGPGGVTTYPGIITDSAGPGGGAVGIKKVNSGTLTLSGANTYTGPTTITATGFAINKLQAGIASIPNVSGAFGNNSAVTLPNLLGASLDLNGYDTQIGSLTGIYANRALVTLGGATLTVGGDNTSPAPYDGDITGNGNLVKIGTGKLTLGRSGAYSGTTTISGGTLALGNYGALPNTVGIALAAGATYDVSQVTSPYTLNGSVTLSASGTNLTTGAAIIKGPAMINLNARPMMLNFTPTVFTGDAAHPALVIAQGNVNASGVAITLANTAGSPLSAGTYTLVTNVSGIITGTPSLAGGTVGGQGIVSGCSAAIELSGDGKAVNLVVSGGNIETTTTLARHAGTGTDP